MNPYNSVWSRLIIIAGILFSTTLSAAEIHVMISAGFYKAYSELVPVFEQETGHKLVTIRGPSQGDSPEAIPTRLKKGEPADVLLMIGASIDDLTSQGLVKAGSRLDLARSEIGMVVRAGSAIPDISSVEAFKKVLLEAGSIAHSDSASGIYLSTTLFEQLGIAAELKGKSRKIQGPPSGEPVAAVVARGEAEIGFQQVSELIHEPGVSYVGPIPAELQQETYYSAALASAATQPEAAEALIRFIASPRGAKAMADAGLAPLNGQ
jgi:molybdate transport system substrate-binding protein